MKTIRFVTGAICLLVSLHMGCETPSQITFKVNTPSDTKDPNPGDGICGDGVQCSLRAAIEEGEASTQQVIYINIDQNGGIALQNGPLVISKKKFFINGYDKDYSFIRANGQSRAMEITGGIVDLKFIGITDGKASGSGQDSDGGNLMIAGNGVLNIRNCLLQGGIADRNGGAIHIGQDAVVTINDAEIRLNKAGLGLGEGGGGIYNMGRLSIVRTYLAGNLGGEKGGGIYHNGARMIIRLSSIYENKGIVAGVNLEGPAELKRVNISDNTDLGPQAPGDLNVAHGLGIRINDQAFFHNVTVVRNGGISNPDDNTDRYAGGIEVLQNGQFSILNTLIAQNSLYDLKGDAISNGYNLIGDASTSGIAAQTGDQFGSFPNILDPLIGQNAFGSHLPSLLQPGSPAIDAGSPDPGKCPDAAWSSSSNNSNTGPNDGDNNGSSICDIGASEYLPPSI